MHQYSRKESISQPKTHKTVARKVEGSSGAKREEGRGLVRREEGRMEARREEGRSVARKGEGRKGRKRREEPLSLWQLQQTLGRGDFIEVGEMRAEEQFESEMRAEGQLTGLSRAGDNFWVK